MRQIPYLLLILALTLSAPVFSQDLGKQICGLEGSKTRLEYIQLFQKQTDIFVTYSPSQWDVTESVSIIKDCLSPAEFFQILMGDSLQAKWFADKVVIFESGINLEAQPFDLSGIIVDAITEERLISATIFLLNQKRGTSSNSFGHFRIAGIEPGESVLVSFVGYNPFVFIPSKDTSSAVIKLQPSILLQPVEVLSSRQQQYEQLSSPDQVLIPSAPYNAGPFLGGEPDILKMIQQETGVLSNEVASGPVVRGGGPDQNLVLLDDIPIYDYNHMLGFTSIFNSDIINRVDFYKGNFPSEFGGRLSSVIDIRTLDGNRNKWEGNVTAGLFSQKMTLGGPVDTQKKMTLIGSGRIATLGTFINLLPIEAIKGFDPSFRDGHVKLSYNPNEKDKINLLYFSSRDRINDLNENDETVAGINVHLSQTESLDWGNRIYGVKWQRKWSDHLFSNTTAYHSRFNFETRNQQQYRFTSPGETVEESYDYFAYSEIQDLGIRTSWEMSYSKNHRVKWGAEVIRHNYIPSIRSEQRTFQSVELDSMRKADPVSVTEWTQYAEWSFTISDNFRMSTGLRQSVFSEDKTLNFNLMPRWSLVVNTGKAASLNIGYSRTIQFLHMLPTPLVGYPTDLWFPGTSNTGPQKAHLLFFNYSLLWKDQWLFQIGSYYKALSGLLNFQNDVLALQDDWQNYLVTGKGTAKGLEVSLEKLRGKLQWGAFYSLGRSDRTFSQINQGRSFPFRYDRTHDLKLKLHYHFSEEVKLGLNWTLASGLPFTLGFTSFQPQAPPGLAYPPTTFIGQRNNERMPWLHRLDVSINIMKKEQKRVKQAWSVGVYNLYNRFNPFAVQVIPEESTQQILLRETSLYPILPFLTYKLSF